MATRKKRKRKPTPRRKETAAQKRKRQQIAESKRRAKEVRRLKELNRRLAAERRAAAGPRSRDLDLDDLRQMILHGSRRQRSIARREIFRREPILREDPHEFARTLQQELGLDYGEAIQLFYYG